MFLNNLFFRYFMWLKILSKFPFFYSGIPIFLEESQFFPSVLLSSSSKIFGSNRTILCSISISVAVPVDLDLDVDSVGAVGVRRVWASHSLLANNKSVTQNP